MSLCETKARLRTLHAGDVISDLLWWDIRDLIVALEELEEENERLNITIARERMEYLREREEL
jgi:DNA-binding MltR family transcriptional regulator